MLTYETDSDSESDREFVSYSGSENEGEEDINKSIPVYRNQLLQNLQSVKRLSNYAYGDSLYEFCHPCLNVYGVGPMSLPLSEDYAKAIVAQCVQAPFGHGEETIIDTTVRNTWQLSPTEFIVENEPQWKAFVDNLAEKACFELGFTNAIIEKRLYKLLVYEQGGFFRPHRDSEKEKGMFASLIIILPSKYEGGQLVVQHNSKENEFDFGGLESDHIISYAAFYADCEHEVRIVSQGYRLCLIYNLINNEQDPTPLPFDDDTALVKQTADNIQLWELDPHGPIKFVYLLEHMYTDDSLSFHNLKGRDRAVTQLMKHTQSYIGTVMVLANMKWKSKFTEYQGEGGYNFNKMFMEPIIGLDGDTFADEGLGVFTQDQVLNQKLFNSRRPEDEDQSETGNEGVEITRQYKATGLVFCLKKNWLIMKCDLLGAKLSIAKMETITNTKEAYEQAQALLKSTALKPFGNYKWNDYNKYDALGNKTLLVRLLASLRQFHFVDIYLDTLRQNVIIADQEPNLSREVVQGCSELGWTELAPTIKQWIERGSIIDKQFIFFHSITFSLIPIDEKQRQSRSDLLDFILKKIIDCIRSGHKYLQYHYGSLPILIESLHHHGHYPLVAEIIEIYVSKVMSDSSYFKLKHALPIIKTTNTCLSYDGFEASIQPYLGKLVKLAISVLNKQIPDLNAVANWESELSCKCKDCEKVKAFSQSLTAQTEHLSVSCNRWEYKVNTWAKVKILRDAVKYDNTKRRRTMKRTIRLTKLSAKKLLQNINYLQSLPYYHATE